MQVNKRLLGSVALVAIIAATNAFAANDFTHWLRAYPSDSPACHHVARDLGERLAEAYGVTVTRATCNAPSNGQGVDIKLEYQAEAELTLVSTKPGLSARIEAGWFTTEADCAAALPEEAEHFAAATGLTPFVAYCYADRLARDYPWVPRVDAFGATTTPPRYDGTLLFGSPYGYTRASLEATIQDSLTQRGIDVRRVTVANVSGYATVTSVYYAPTRLPLATGEFGKLGSRAECEAELDALHDIYAGGDTPALALFCAASSIGGSELQGIFLGDIGYAASPSVETFETYAACAADKERLIEMYRSVGRDIVGGVCSRPTDPSLPRAWVVTLFEE